MANNMKTLTRRLNAAYHQSCCITNEVWTFQGESKPYTETIFTISIVEPGENGKYTQYKVTSYAELLTKVELLCQIGYHREQKAKKEAKRITEKNKDCS